MHKKAIFLLLVMLVSSACAGGAQTATPAVSPAPAASPTAPQTTPASPENIAAAQVFLNALIAGDFTGAAANFDDAMTSALPADKLQEVWEQVVAAVGAYQSVVRTRSEVVENYEIVYITCQFASAPLDVKVVFDSAGKITGLFFQPAELTPAAAYSPPGYADPASFSETAVTVGSGEWALPGTLTLPAGDGPFPAVVLVHGSGPNDRDETIGPNKPFQDIAWGLASQGIAVLRYDKRTFALAEKFTPEILAGLTLNEETVDDALLAVQLLRANPAIDAQRIFVAGHSLGAMAAPRIAQRDPQLAGIILLAAPARRFEDIYLAQLHYLANLDGSLSDAEQQALDAEAAKAERVKDPELDPATDPELLPLGIPAAYWQDLDSYDPVQVAAALDMRMLILQGERDYQVTMEDFSLWQTALSGKAGVILKSFPGLNHLFMAGEGPGNPQEYTIPAHVAEAVIQEISAWIVQP